MTVSRSFENEVAESLPDGGVADRPVPDYILDGLNPNQRDAVAATEGPVLVVAGAGSGKTQVLTRRVAGLVASGVDPSRILAITFTNKAAGEMRTRVGDLVGTETMNEMWVCTFHSMCVKILRHSGPHRWFTILDQRDSRSVLKEILDSRSIDSSGGVLRKVQTYISNAKNRLVRPAPDKRNQAAQIAAEVFDEYQARLRGMKAYDFDDLLTETVRLFADHPDIRRAWQDRFDYILIDEYQDTNRAQYVIVRALAARHRNVCVVGDPDQCLLPGTKISTPDGRAAIEDIQEGQSVLAIGGRGHQVAARVAKMKKGEWFGNIYTIHTAAGSVTGTPHHILPVACGGGNIGWPVFAYDTHPDYPHHGARDESESGVELTMFAGGGDGVGRHLVRQAGSGDAAAYKSYLDAATEARQLAAATGQLIWRRMQIRDKIYDLQPLSHIHPGDRVLVDDGTGGVAEQDVLSVTVSTYSGPVYDLEVVDAANYLADGHLVHNSIYSFRAANVENILNFEQDYEETRVFTLDQNYRSTKKILRAAQAVIAENKGQRRANLWTEGDEGEEILLYVASDDRDEASYVARRVRSFGEPGEHAVLYRANFQSRVIEEALAEEGIPYMLVGGTRFYDRAEVRDGLAYLRFANNPTDIVSFQRSVNSPRRGIGKATVDAILEWSEGVGEENLLVAAETVELSTRARNSVDRWLQAIRHVRDLAERHGPGAAIAGAILGADGDLAAMRRAVGAGYDPLLALADCAGNEGLARPHLKRGTPDGRDRLENLVELVNAADRWVANQFGVNLTEGEELDWAKIDGRDQTSAFLEHVALITDLEFAEETQGGGGAVRLMTIHAAKGLEFPHVTIVGMEEGILPMGGPDDLAEERRLAYVAITRAEKTLALTRARRRFVFGDVRTAPPSQFLQAVESTVSYTPGELAWQKKTGGVGGGGGSRYEVGMWVTHAQFGRGQVFSVNGVGGDVVVGVLFAGGVRRTLHTRYANLQIEKAA